MLGRGLEELTLGALEIVVDLIESNSLYRGEEHLKAVRGFTAIKREFDDLPKDRRDVFVWSNIDNKYARFRNTAIGTLVDDISGGMDVTKSVKRFESKVAPHNYRRTSAPITKGMINKALETLRELGLDEAVRRRFAVIGDVSPADVLFVDRSVRPHMKDDLADLLMGEAKAPKLSNKGAIDISGEDFFENILPGARGWSCTWSGVTPGTSCL